MGEKLLFGFVILAVCIIGYIFLGGKKTKKTKEKAPVQEKKVEQAVKSDKPKQEEKKEEDK